MTDKGRDAETSSAWQK